MYSSARKYFIQFSIVAFVLGFIPTLYFIHAASQLETQAVSSVEKQTRLQLEFSQHDLLRMLESTHQATQLLAKNDLLFTAVTTPSKEALSQLKTLWDVTLRSQAIFSSFRLLDRQGKEQLKAIYDGHQVAFVESAQTTDPFSQQIVAQYAQLTTPQVWATQVAMSAETPSGMLPTFRFVTGIEHQGQRQGFLVVTVKLQSLYQRLSFIYDQFDSPDILNSAGELLLSEHKPSGTRSTSSLHFSAQHPELWQKIQLNQQGFALSNQTWFSYIKVDLSSVLPDFKPLVLVLRINKAEIDKIYANARWALMSQAVTVLSLLSIIAAGFAAWNINHLKNSLDSKLARAAMDGMSAVVITDRQNRIIKVNNEFTRLSGYTFEDVKGKQPSIFASGLHKVEFYMQMWKALQDNGVWEGEVINKRKDGESITEILRIQSIRDENNVIQFYVASFVDISHRKALENRLRELSEKDSLTDLWNRRKFDQTISLECAKRRRYPDQAQSCLAIIDIDHFKRINDKFGHNEGDLVLRTVAKGIQDQLRESDFIARIGGEEFAIIFPYTSIEEAEQVLNRVRLHIASLHHQQVTLSGGVTDVCTSPDQSYKRADLALYESKTSGRNQISVLTAMEMHHLA
ncbi:diguanylate cyclase [Vibrio tarriae]|uniref:sensor domain-containing diguanylate cyclase n=1 Tax=Vibrio tarriae TaxID=2014742 RepID=UPI000DE51075|nr:sensor domain-containing diguanylate cyclase [Vibrio tarriae]RBM42433.1 sensory histidine kinase [Vibrio tarriae]